MYIVIRIHGFPHPGRWWHFLEEGAYTYARVVEKKWFVRSFFFSTDAIETKRKPISNRTRFVRYETKARTPENVVSVDAIKQHDQPPVRDRLPTRDEVAHVRRRVKGRYFRSRRRTIIGVEHWTCGAYCVHTRARAHTGTLTGIIRGTRRQTRCRVSTRSIRKPMDRNGGYIVTEIMRSRVLSKPRSTMSRKRCDTVIQ